MSTPGHSFELNGNTQETTYQVSKQSFSNEQDFVDQFLDQLALCGSNTQTKSKNAVQLKIDKQPTISNLESGETLIPLKKRSLFHNFQKHLISSLRRFFHINLKTFGQSPYKQLAYSLWHSFLKVESCNKHILHLIFGMSLDQHTESKLREISCKFKSFQKIWQRNNIEDILKAQELIRSVIVNQSRQINKKLLQANCHIRKFDVFYQYFNDFFEELSEGPMARRLRKVRISLLMQKLINETSGI